MNHPEPELPADRPVSPAELDPDALRSGGAFRLSDEELLNLVLRGRHGRRGGSGVAQLLGSRGIGVLAEGIPAAAWASLSRDQGVRLAATLELANRIARLDSPHAPRVSNPQEVFEVTSDLKHRRREHFVGLYLNTRNRLLARETISVGSLNASIVHPREVFAPALRLGAACLIVVHNHPSGETDPSDEDIGLSRRLAEVGDILGIELLDHVIVGSGGFTSLRESGEF